MRGAAKIIVKGTVQSIFFRNFVKEKADALSIKGIARNLDNGDVEIIAEGEKENIAKLLEEIKQGPKYSQIRSVTAEERKWTGDLKEFKVLRF
jgi:acylphosphatase